jgi:hypothetical protein
VEQRKEPRVKFNEPVTITALQNGEANFAGRVVDLSSDDMKIKSNASLEIGSLLRLEVGDDVMMTEVRQCVPDDGEYSAGLLILARLEKSELKRLRREAVAGPMPEPNPHEPALLVVA